MSKRVPAVSALIVGVGSAFVTAPVRGEQLHKIQIDYQKQGACVQEGSIRVAPALEEINSKDSGFAHKEWFNGKANAADAPQVQWDVAFIADYKWKVGIKDSSKRHFFKDRLLDTGMPHTAINNSKAVDKILWPNGIIWEYFVLAVYTGDQDCAAVEILDPQVKFKSGSGFLGVFFTLAIGLLVVALLFRVVTRIGRP